MPPSKRITSRQTFLRPKVQDAATLCAFCDLQMLWTRNLPHAPATKYVFVHIPVKKVLSKVAVLRNCETKAMSWVRGCPTY